MYETDDQEARMTRWIGNEDETRGWLVGPGMGYSLVMSINALSQARTHGRFLLSGHLVAWDGSRYLVMELPLSGEDAEMYLSGPYNPSARTAPEPFPPDTAMPASVSQAELAAALSRMNLPAESGAMIPADSGTGSRQAWIVLDGTLIAAGVFRAVWDLRTEAGRWIDGELYETRFTVPSWPGKSQPHEVRCVYRREPGGWFAYNSADHFRDGSLDTRGFRRLVPEGDDVS